MRIAIVGAARYPAPTPKGYIHAPLDLATELSNFLSQRGHNVSFFGAKGTKTKANLITCEIKPFYKRNDISRDFAVAYEQILYSKALQNQNEFDIYYFHNGPRSLPLASLIKKPVVITHHDSTHIKDYSFIYNQYRNNKNIFFIAISNHVKKLLPNLSYIATTHNGVDPEKFKFVEKAKPYFVWSGRVVPPKGLHIALKLAEKLDFNLKIAGNLGPFLDFENTVDYFEKLIKPRLNLKNVQYVGSLSKKENIDLVANAKALLFPSSGQECSPMTVIEAMMSGTPIIATNKGPLPEMIKNGVNGFLSKSEKEVIKNIKAIGTIDRKMCRDYAEKKFSIERMVTDYEKAFSKAIKLTKQ